MYVIIVMRVGKCRTEGGNGENSLEEGQHFRSLAGAELQRVERET